MADVTQLSNGISVVANSTTSNANAKYVLTNLKTNTNYRLSCDATIISSGKTEVKVEGSADGTNYTSIYAEANRTSYDVVFNTASYTYIRLTFYASGSSTASGYGASYTNLMLRLASDPDSTYQPYAMTNRELTENVTNKSADTLSAVSGCSITSQACVRIGNLFVGEYVISATSGTAKISGFPTFVVGGNSASAIIRNLSNGNLHTSNNYVNNGEHAITGLTSGTSYAVIVIGIVL